MCKNMFKVSLILLLAISSNGQEYCISESDCSTFHVCGDESVLLHCPKGLAFNETIQECDYAKNVPGCELNNLRCTDSDQKYAVGCGFYRFCDSLEEHPCPSNTAFNEDIQACDYPGNVTGCEHYTPSILTVEGESLLI